MEQKHLVRGIAINDLDGCSDTQAYSAWSGMLMRCYSLRFKVQYPTYMDCKPCLEWLTFSNFKKWFDTHYVEGWALDKDLLVKGNKVYSPHTCCFLPPEVNSFIVGADYDYDYFASRADKAKEYAERYKDKLDPRAYEELCNFRKYVEHMDDVFECLDMPKEEHTPAKKHKSFEDTFKLFEQIMSDISINDEDRAEKIQSFKEQDPLVVRAYNEIGSAKIEKMQYRRWRVETELVKRDTTRNIAEKCISILDLHVGDNITVEQKRKKLNDLKETLELDITPKLEDYYTTKETKKRVHGKLVTSYRIISVRAIAEHYVE